MSQHRPAWWQLYILFPLMIGLILLEQFRPLPETAPELVDVGIVMLSFGAMLGWMRINSGLIESEEMQKDRSLRNLKITVYDAETGSTADPGVEDLALPQDPESPIEASSETELDMSEDEATWSLN
jgi:hypothetical protein